MNIPDLIDGFITWQSTLPCRANQETPFVDERFFENREFAGKRFLLSLPLPLHALFCARPNFRAAKKAKSASNVRKAFTETLATQATHLRFCLILVQICS